MATCETCGQEMRTAASCTLELIEYADGVTLPRLRWDDDEGERCGDCGVEPGGFHHLNCDQEICPRCKRQLIGACDCPLSPACPNDDTMAAGDLLRQYVELVRWEVDVAQPAGILTDTERYPEPWRQRREFFDSHWQDGDAAEVMGGGTVTQDDTLGAPMVAVETDAAVIITDDCNGDGYFRIPKKTGP